MATKDITDLQVLQAVTDSIADRAAGWPVDLLMARTGQCEKVCWSAMWRASGRGLLDYGISLRGSWVTDAGRSLIASLQSVESPLPVDGTEVWQEYDCPVSGIDFDIFPPHLLKRGDVFHCSGCGQDHTAGVDVVVQQCEDRGGDFSFSSIDIVAPDGEAKH